MTILPLSSCEIRSELVGECIRSLNQLGKDNTLLLIWVPGHQGIKGNEIADELARKGASSALMGPEPFMRRPWVMPLLTKP